MELIDKIFIDIYLGIFKTLIIANILSLLSR